MLAELGARVGVRPHAKQYSPAFISGIVRLVDLLMIIAVGFGVYWAYVNPGFSFNSLYVTAIFLACLLGSTVFQWFGVYAPSHMFFRRFPIDRVLSAWAVTFAILITIAVSLKITDTYSRVWAGVWFVGTATLLTGGRMVLGHWISQLAGEGRFAERTVILGASEQGQRLAAHLNEQGDLYTRIVGFVDDRSSRVPASANGYELLGDTSHLIELIRRDMVDQVFVALPWGAAQRVREIIHQLSVTPVRICLAPESVCFDYPDHGFMRVGHVPMLQVFERPISGWSYVSKTIEDRLLAALLILFTGPLMLLIALAIKLDSRGPVFFKQMRYGFNNTLIRVWKFRSMYTDMADVHCDVQTRKDDPRITRVGHFLRQSSLDELPQLFNVLLGSMSLVGPRPHALSTKANGSLFTDIVDRYAARHRVKPGITGWAQVNGWRGETDTVEKIQKRVDFDLYYIDNWSIWLDIKILIKTVFVILKDDNAY
jgi:Undecaprenyl-phosphate glucose phosphotransferase